MSSPSTRDFGPLVRLDAESRGQPGQRTFRIIAANEFEVATLHIEKEQLQALGLAIAQLLAQIDEPAGAGDLPTGAAGDFETIDMRVGRLGLGFDESADLFVIVAYAEDNESEGTPDFQCRADRAQMAAMSKKIEEVINAGRPRCPLCSAPINPGGHTCVRSNGHFKTTG